MMQIQPDREAQLRAESVHLTLEAELYKKVVHLMKLAEEHLDDIDPSLYELDKNRVQELRKIIAAPVEKTAKGIVLKLSHMDLFDLEATSHMAEGFPQSFGGDEAIGMNFEELSALTDKFETCRKRAFPA